MDLSLSSHATPPGNGSSSDELTTPQASPGHDAKHGPRHLRSLSLGSSLELEDDKRNGKGFPELSIRVEAPTPRNIPLTGGETVFKLPVPSCAVEASSSETEDIVKSKKKKTATEPSSYSVTEILSWLRSANTPVTLFARNFLALSLRTLGDRADILKKTMSEKQQQKQMESTEQLDTIPSLPTFEPGSQSTLTRRTKSMATVFSPYGSHDSSSMHMETAAPTATLDDMETAEQKALFELLRAKLTQEQDSAEPLGSIPSNPRANPDTDSGEYCFPVRIKVTHNGVVSDNPPEEMYQVEALKNALDKQIRIPEVTEDPEPLEKMLEQTDLSHEDMIALQKRLRIARGPAEARIKLQGDIERCDLTIQVASEKDGKTCYVPMYSSAVERGFLNQAIDNASSKNDADTLAEERKVTMTGSVMTWLEQLGGPRCADALYAFMRQDFLGESYRILSERQGFSSGNTGRGGEGYSVVITFTGPDEMTIHATQTHDRYTVIGGHSKPKAADITMKLNAKLVKDGENFTITGAEAEFVTNTDEKLVKQRKKSVSPKASVHSTRQTKEFGSTHTSLLASSMASLRRSTHDISQRSTGSSPLSGAQRYQRSTSLTAHSHHGVHVRQFSNPETTLTTAEFRTGGSTPESTVISPASSSSAISSSLDLTSLPRAGSLSPYDSMVSPSQELTETTMKLMTVDGCKYATNMDRETAERQILENIVAAEYKSALDMEAKKWRNEPTRDKTMAYNPFKQGTTRLSKLSFHAPTEAFFTRTRNDIARKHAQESGSPVKFEDLSEAAKDLIAKHEEAYKQEWLSVKEMVEERTSQISSATEAASINGPITLMPFGVQPYRQLLDATEKCSADMQVLADNVDAIVKKAKEKTISLRESFQKLANIQAEATRLSLKYTLPRGAAGRVGRPELTDLRVKSGIIEDNLTTVLQQGAAEYADVYQSELLMKSVLVKVKVDNALVALRPEMDSDARACRFDDCAVLVKDQHIVDPANKTLNQVFDLQDKGLLEETDSLWEKGKFTLPLTVERRISQFNELSRNPKAQESIAKLDQIFSTPKPLLVTPAVLEGEPLEKVIQSGRTPVSIELFEETLGIAIDDTLPSEAFNGDEEAYQNAVISEIKSEILKSATNMREELKALELALTGEGLTSPSPSDT